MVTVSVKLACMAQADMSFSSREVRSSGRECPLQPELARQLRSCASLFRDWQEPVKRGPICFMVAQRPLVARNHSLNRLVRSDKLKLSHLPNPLEKELLSPVIAFYK